MPAEVTKKAFLVRPTISVWSARKLDKDATESTQRTAGATDKAGVRVYKSLVASDELERVKELNTAIRAAHHKRTVPWHYEGPGAITAAGFPAYVEEFNGLQVQFNHAADAFCAKYADAREAAKTDLAGLFDEADYPAVDVIRSKFAVSLSCEPMPESSDFRVQGLSDKHINAIKADMQARFDAALKSAQSHTWDQIVGRVEHLMKKLREFKTADESTNGKGSRFYDTTVTNIQELVNMLPSLNITNDPALTDIATRLQRELCQETPDDLKKNAGARETVANAAEAILTEIWAKRRAARGEGAAA